MVLALAVCKAGENQLPTDEHLPGEMSGSRRPEAGVAPPIPSAPVKVDLFRRSAAREGGPRRSAEREGGTAILGRLVKETHGGDMRAVLQGGLA